MRSQFYKNRNPGVLLTEENLKRELQECQFDILCKVDEMQSPDLRGAGTHLSCSPSDWQVLSTPQSSPTSGTPHGRQPST